MRNSKNSSIPEIQSSCNTTTGLRSTFKQQSLHHFEYPPKKSLLQLKVAKQPQNRSQNISYQAVQSKLRKTHSQDRRTINQSFDIGRHSDKQLHPKQQRNRSLSNARTDDYQRRNHELMELRKENDELKMQLIEFQRLDEQHKDIQKLMKQQMDCQAKFYQRELGTLQRQLEINEQTHMNRNNDTGLESLFQRETHHLASLLQTLPVQKSTYQKLLSTISLWLEQLFMKVGQALPQQPKPVKGKINTQISENESQIDLGQLINFNEESDMLEWDSPQVSYKCHKRQETNDQIDRFRTDRSDNSLRRSSHHNKENINYN